ncbi:MAG: CHAT domain-containing protein [Acidobacteriota bacterium]
MPFIRSIARGTMTLCITWPLLFIQIQPAIGQTQKADSEALPPLDLDESEPLVLPGVVIEEIPEDSALKRAGLQPGDVILSWERLPNPPANPEGASGTIESPFDWMWLEVEQAPRGVIRFRGKRGTQDLLDQVPLGRWSASVRPVFAPSALQELGQARADLLKGDSVRVLRLAAKLVDRYRASACYLLFPALSLDGHRPAAYSSRSELGNTCPAGFPLSRAVEFLGLNRYFKEDYSGAREFLVEALALLPESCRLGLAESRLKRELAMTLAKTNEPDAALDYAKDSLQVSRVHAPGSLAEADSAAQLALLYYEKHSFRDATPLWERALGLYEVLWPTSPHIGGLKYNLGTLYHLKGDDKRAAEFLEESLAFWREHPPGSKGPIANLMISIGQIARGRGDLATAETYYLQALGVLEGLDNNQANIAGALNNLAGVSSERGDIELAESRWRRSLLGFTAVQPGSQEVADVLTNLSHLYCEAGEVAECEVLLTRAIEIQRRLAPRSSVLSTQLNSLAFLQAQNGQFDLAIKTINQANQLLDNDSPELATGLMNLGNIYGRRGDVARARTYFLDAIERQEKSGSCRTCYASNLVTLGDFTLRSGKLSEAEKVYKKALAVSNSVGIPSVEASVYIGLAEVSLKRSQYAVAREDFLKALDGLERQSVELGGASDRKNNFRARNRGVYRKAVLSSLRLGDWASGFQILERSRGRGLLELISERTLKWATEEGSETAAAVREIEAKLAQTRRARSGVDSKAGFASLEDVIRDEESLFAARDRAISALRTSQPRFAALQYPQALNAVDAQKSLDSGTLMLSYLAGDDEVYLFALSRERGPHAYTLLASGTQVRQRVERFRELISEARPGTALGDLKLTELRQLGKDLYDILLKPAEAEIEKAERVMIVADGPLHYLPLAALSREIVGEDGVKRDQYLAEWKPFHSVLSATVFAELKKDRRDPAKPDDGTALEFVGFGDPIFPASVTLKDPEKIADIRLRSAARQGTLELAPLPNTRREVEGIAALFPPNREQTFLGAEATEEKVKAIGRGARILHFATHARLDDRFPLNSSLLLSMPESFPEDRENGILQVWEIFEGMRLDADLVVLSACDSGLGEEQGGEGLIGLTRAFQYAGARTVIASLWEVRDEATAELMIRFYRHLTSGQPKDQALQAAQRELLAGPIEIPGPDGQTIRFDATAPYYWAAFQVIGDWK